MIFALKVIMSTIDHVEANVNKDHMTAHKPYLKSRKEVRHTQTDTQIRARTLALCVYNSAFAHTHMSS